MIGLPNWGQERYFLAEQGDDWAAHVTTARELDTERPWREVQRSEFLLALVLRMFEAGGAHEVEFVGPLPVCGAVHPRGVRSCELPAGHDGRHQRNDGHGLIYHWPSAEDGLPGP